MKIAFLIRSLDDGGAQRQLVYLSKGLVRDGHDVFIYSFYGGGTFESDLEKSGIQVRNLGKSGRWDIFVFLYTSIKFILKDKPEILHSYLGTANVISTFLKIFSPRMKLVWGIRSSNTDLSKYDWFWRLSYFLETRLSILPRVIIANSKSGKEYSVSKGFPKKKIVVIPNGIDTEKFYPDLSARRYIRKKWKIAENIKIIALVARLDPKKDHPNFLKAAYLASEIIGDLAFLCVGRSNDSSYKERLHFLSNKLGLGDHIMWMDSTNDMRTIYNGIDLLCLSSAYGEGFPNVLGEAMACGIPCIATDVGDSGDIIGKFGLIVPPRDTFELARGIVKMIGWIDKEKEGIPRLVRQQIVDNFGTEKLFSKTEEILFEIKE